MDIFALGDSITQGAGASSLDRGFLSLVCAELDASVTRFQRGGATSATGADWIDYVTREPFPDLALVAYGVNDQIRSGLRRRQRVPPPEFEANIERIVRRMRDRWREIPVVLLVPCPPQGFPPEPGYPEAIGRVATAKGCLLAEPRWDGADLYSTPAHPNDAGHALLAEAVLQALRRASPRAPDAD